MKTELRGLFVSPQDSHSASASRDPGRVILKPFLHPVNGVHTESCCGLVHFVRNWPSSHVVLHRKQSLSPYVAPTFGLNLPAGHSMHSCGPGCKLCFLPLEKYNRFPVVHRRRGTGRTAEPWPDQTRACGMSSWGCSVESAGT